MLPTQTYNRDLKDLMFDRVYTRPGHSSDCGPGLARQHLVSPESRAYAGHAQRAAAT